MPPELFKKAKNEPDSDATSAAPAAEGRGQAAVERVLTATGARMTENKPSIISEGFSFKGDIASNGTLHVDGTIDGNLKVDGITIGPNGVVHGSVVCQRLHVKGKFHGTGECDDLQVDTGAIVDGTVSYRVLTAQRGAVLSGDLLVRK